MAAGVSWWQPDVGDSNWRPGAVSSLTVLLQPLLEVEGINITSSHDLDTGVYSNSYRSPRRSSRRYRIMRMSELLAFTWSRP